MKKTIVWNQLLSSNKLEIPTHKIQNIHINNQFDIVEVIIEKGKDINSVKFSMAHAQKIGFINLDKLENYCK